MDSIESWLTYLLSFLVVLLTWIIIKKCRGGKDDGGGGDSSGSESDGSEDDPDAPTDSSKRNLLKNNCGKDQYQHWKVMASGGDGWAIEDIPIGADQLPKTSEDGDVISDFGTNTSCFATSDDLCMKEQLVDLLAEGFKEKELDSQPPIEVSEWYACHADCPGNYLINVTLLSKDKQNLKSFMHMEDFSALPRRKWHKVSNTFLEYGTGVRYVSFNHGGQSSQKMSGHYGSKISGGVVRVLLPETEN